MLSFVRQGSLHSLLASSTASSAWYSRPYGVMRCMRDMAAVLQHIHSCGIVHRDVSARNILVDSDGSMVLADLGLAVQMPAASTAPAGAAEASTAAVLVAEDSQTAVPVRWTSPEALARSQYSSRSDVWSLGVAVWEMTAGGRLPYADAATSTRACIRPINACQWRLQVDERWGRDDDGSMSAAERRLAEGVRRLVALCLTHECEQRPDSEQLVAAAAREWEGWTREAGQAAERLEQEWEAWHADVQRRLGCPTDHGESPPLARSD